MSPATVDTLLAISLVNAVGERGRERGGQWETEGPGISSARCRRQQEREMYKITAIFFKLIGRPQKGERERREDKEKEGELKRMGKIN